MKKGKELFFSSDFLRDLDWKSKKLIVGSVNPHYKGQIAQGLRYMSSESIRYRFLGSKKEFTSEELEYLTELDGWNHYAIGILEGDHPEKGIAIIRMVRSSKNPHEAEVAITVIDQYQKKGLGTFLMNLMVLAAKEREIERLSFTFLPLNEGIFRLVEELKLPYTREYGRDFIQIYLDISGADTDRIKSRLSKNFPAILH